MKYFPEGQPDLIPPEPLPLSEFTDLASLSTMNSHYKQWWKDFALHQFDETFGQLTVEQEEDFWSSNQQSYSTNNSSSISSEEFSAVHITHHPTMIWGKKNGITIMAIRPDPEYSASDSDELPKNEFWLAKLIKQTAKDTIYVQYYALQTDSSYQLLEKYELINISTVIYQPVSLTSIGKLSKKEKALIKEQL